MYKIFQHQIKFPSCLILLIIFVAFGMVAGHYSYKRDIVNLQQKIERQKEMNILLARKVNDIGECRRNRVAGLQ